METLLKPPAELKNPGLKYLAATRLGACQSPSPFRDSGRWSQRSDDLYERITRRKALEPPGRRKDARRFPFFLLPYRPMTNPRRQCG